MYNPEVLAAIAKGQFIITLNSERLDLVEEAMIGDDLALIQLILEAAKKKFDTKQEIIDFAIHMDAEDGDGKEAVNILQWIHKNCSPAFFALVVDYCKYIGRDPKRILNGFMLDPITGTLSPHLRYSDQLAFGLNRNSVVHNRRLMHLSDREKLLADRSVREWWNCTDEKQRGWPIMHFVFEGPIEAIMAAYQSKVEVNPEQLIDSLTYLQQLIDAGDWESFKFYCGLDKHIANDTRKPFLNGTMPDGTVLTDGNVSFDEDGRVKSFQFGIYNRDETQIRVVSYDRLDLTRTIEYVRAQSLKHGTSPADLNKAAQAKYADKKQALAAYDRIKLRLQTYMTTRLSGTTGLVSLNVSSTAGRAARIGAQALVALDIGVPFYALATGAFAVGVEMVTQAHVSTINIGVLEALYGKDAEVVAIHSAETIVDALVARGSHALSEDHVNKCYALAILQVNSLHKHERGALKDESILNATLCAKALEFAEKIAQPVVTAAPVVVFSTAAKRSGSGHSSDGSTVATPSVGKGSPKPASSGSSSGGFTPSKDMHQIAAYMGAEDSVLAPAAPKAVTAGGCCVMM